jgi:hypothetical protein
LKRHRLVLEGGDGAQLRISGDQLAELLAALMEGARLALRYQVEGISNPPGPRPRWLEACTSQVITGLHAGSAVLEIEAPTLEEAAPEVFGASGQISLLQPDEPLAPPASTALDLFAAVLQEIQQGDRPTLRADRSLLEGCLRFARVPSGAFTGISLGSVDAEGPTVTLHASDIPLLEELVLHSDDGDKMQARLPSSVTTEDLRALFGQRVVVAGVAEFRPSGRIQQIAINQIQPAHGADELFSETPRAWGSMPVFTPAAQEPGSGVSIFFGTWPGEETDDELITALAAIR